MIPPNFAGDYALNRDEIWTKLRRFEGSRENRDGGQARPG